MKYRTLGRTGVRVSNLCLGTMMFGTWGNKDHDESIRVVHRALDAGINMIDTADLYSHGEAETIVGKALAGGRRDNVVLASKFHNPMGDDVNARGNSRRWIVQAVENSLRRLQTDHLDLYQVHRPDPDTDIEETLGALTDLQRAGKIRYFGTTTYPAHELVTAQWTSERRNFGRFVTEQPPYSLFARGIEADVLPVAQQLALGVLVWSPLGGGWLSGAYRKDSPDFVSDRNKLMPGLFDITAPHNAGKLDAAEALALLAEELGISLIHLALGFVLSHPAVTAAIIGPMNVDQLESQLADSDLVLDHETLDRIDDIVSPGRNMTERDAGYLPPAIVQPSLRRR
ncbi:aldo/keto reductase [Rhodococcoides fascians]|uniref:aldo/keto reductase n=1 Tax=Rhodococcoides fascians TaxID=1828 RepID=UPI0005641844|nr:aldo/keto reductase [Rhodococcus fascians]